MREFRIVHFTDLHLEAYPGNLPAALELSRQSAADLILVGGDNGGDDGIRQTVTALRTWMRQTPIAWVKGNHDLWGREYRDVFRDCDDLDATYLELANLELPECTVVGTYGHYDYGAGSRSIALDRYESFTDGKVVWNDRYISRLGKTNPEIAAELAAGFSIRYGRAEKRGLPIVVLTHTSPVGPGDDSKRSFVTAYLANTAIGERLANAASPPAAVFFGHTHRPMRTSECGYLLINPGSDYREVRIATHALKID